MSLVVISFRIPGGLRAYLQFANEIVTTSMANNNISSAAMGLRLLACLPEELAASDITSDLREELTEQLTNYVWSIFSILDGLSSCKDSTLILLMLATAKAWCGQGMNLTSLCISHPATFQLILSCCQSSDSFVVLECWSFIQELVAVSEYPRSSQRSQILSSLLQLVNQRLPTLDLTDSSVSTALCNLLVSIGSVELSTLAREDLRVTGFFPLLLSTIQLRPRRLLMLSFDLWLELQDTPYEELHPCVREEVVPSLLGSIVSHCRHSREVEEGDEEEQEDWESLRDPRLGLSELLSVCHFALQTPGLFQSLYQLLPAPQPTSGLVDISLHASAAQLEVVLYLLTQIDSLKTMVESARSNSSEEVSLVVTFLYELTARCLAVSEAQYHTCGGGAAMSELLKRSVCRFLGKLTFLLTKNTSLYLGIELRREGGAVLDARVLLLPSLRLLLSSIPSRNGSVSREASTAFNQLCTHGMKWLTSREQLPLLQEMCVVYGQYVQNWSVVCLDSLLSLTDSLVRCVVSLGGGDSNSSETQVFLLNLLTEPVVNVLLAECNSGNGWNTRVHCCLSLISQIVRFCDGPAAVTPGSHILLPLLQRVWPLLEQIGSACQQDSGASADSLSSKILTVIFEIFTRVFSSLGALALAQADHVANLILAVLRCRGSPSCPAALKCAAGLVEYFVTIGNTNTFPPQYVGYLPALFCGVVEVFYSTYQSFLPSAANAVAACLMAFNQDLDCIQEFFAFVYAMLVFSPGSVVKSSQAISPIVELLLLCLQGCSEREPLRVILQVLQCGFCPPSHNSTPALQREVSDQFLNFGERIVRQLLQLLSQGALVVSLSSNVAESLLSIIAGCNSENQLTNCQSWFHGAIVTETGCFVRLETHENRLLTLNLIFFFARQNSRRFKVLIQDLMKICSSELNVDALMAYSDVLA